MTTIGYVVVSKREDTDEDWFLDHSGEAWDRATAQSDAAKWANDNPGYETAVAAVVIDEEES